MDRLQLKHYLEDAGVAEDRYLLVGVNAPRPVGPGACIVRPNQRSWEVLVWGPVRLQLSLTFLAESEACEYVLDVLTADLPRVAPSLAAAQVPARAGAAPRSGQKESDVAELVP